MNENEPTNSKTKLMQALAAGAAAAFRPNLMDRLESQKEISAAYLELKEMIQQQYGQLDVDLLDIGPGSEERQAALNQQLQEAGATEDEDILKQAQVVLEIISKEEPEALWAAQPADPAPQHK